MCTALQPVHILNVFSRKSFEYADQTVNFMQRVDHRGHRIFPINRTGKSESNERVICNC